MSTKTRFVLFAAALSGLTQAADNPAFVHTIAERAEWSVGNALVERTVRFDAKDGLRTVRWLHRLTGTDFVRQAAAAERRGEEFAFDADGAQVNGRSGLALVSAETRNLGNGKALRLMLRTGDGRFDVAVTYGAYDDEPAIRKWIEITNRTPAPVTLTRLCFEAINAAPGPADDLQLWAGYGDVPREIFFTGRVSDTALVSRSERTGEGLIVLNEAPGYLKRTEMGGGWNDSIRVMYDTDLFPFVRTLAPGETFTSAKSSILFFEDGHGLADRGWVAPGYASRVLLRRGSAYQPPWIYNTWEPFQRRIDEATSAQLIRVAGRMGMDIFTIDDGWQAEYGDNAENRKSFPAGLDGIRNLLEGRRMALGLWVPLAAISTASADYRQHPEWICRDRDGRPKFTGTAAGRQAVMCLGSDYREAAARRLLELIDQYHPKYIKVDLTTVFNAYGEEPGCNAPGHYHKSWAESLTRIYEGLQFVGQRLYEAHPEVLVDFTFELWGEKHLIDHGLLGAADLDWLSNVNDYDPGDAGTRQTRMLLFHRAQAIPAEAMLIGNLHAATRPIEERFGMAIGSGPLLLGDLRKLSAEEQYWYAEKIGWFKQLRRGATLNDSFFPLGDWAQNGVHSWDGFARLSRQSGGIVVIFRNDSGAKQAVIRLPGPPGARYEARSVMTGRALGPVTTESLLNGWSAPLNEAYRVEVIELRRQKSAGGNGGQ